MRASLIGVSGLTGNILLPPYLLGVLQTNSKSAKVVGMGTVETETNLMCFVVSNVRRWKI